jgi:hypothetical protein
MREEMEAAERANDSRRLAHQMDALERARAAKRDTQPLPAGSLFDATHRATRDLF